MNREQLAEAITTLVDQMERHGENDMGVLSFAEAAMIHTATDLMKNLYASIIIRPER